MRYFSLLVLFCLSFILPLSAQQVNEDFSDYKNEVKKSNLSEEEKEVYLKAIENLERNIEDIENDKAFVHNSLEVEEKKKQLKRIIEDLNKEREYVVCEPNIHIDSNPATLYRIRLFIFSILSALFSLGVFISLVRKIRSQNRIIKAQREKIDRLYNQKF